MTTPVRRWRLGLIGFGSVGRSLARLLLRTEAELRERHAVRFDVTFVATRRGGARVEPAGLPLASLLAETSAGGAEASVTGTSTSSSAGPAHGILADPATPVDIVIEMSPLDRRAGEPAATHLRLALERGCHVVTANKGPLAWHWAELMALAARLGRALRYEATLMDCLPAQVLRETVVPVGRVRAFAAIPNSTTNYLLTAMGEGRGRDEALVEAQRLGIAEADPSDDLEGWDAALKATILHNLLFDEVPPITSAAVERHGFEAIDPAWPRRAALAGRRVKLVARGRPGAPLRLAPEELDVSQPLAGVSGFSMALSLETELAGRLDLVLVEPHTEQTAYAILVDLLAIDRAHAAAT